jgi:hypothetical protein
MTTTQTTPSLTTEIVRAHTAFGTCEEMLAAIKSGYVPTVSKRRQAPLLIALRAEHLPAFVID